MIIIIIIIIIIIVIQRENLQQYWAREKKIILNWHNPGSLILTKNIQCWRLEGENFFLISIR